MAVCLPDLVAAVSFYRRQPKPEDVAQTSARLLIQNAGLDKRIGAGAPSYEAALMANNIEFTARNYVGVNQIFHNDKTLRYDATAVELAWQKTVVFFKQNLLRGLAGFKRVNYLQKFYFVLGYI